MSDSVVVAHVSARTGSSGCVRKGTLRYLQVQRGRGTAAWMMKVREIHQPVAGEGSIALPLTGDATYCHIIITGPVYGSAACCLLLAVGVPCQPLFAGPRLLVPRMLLLSVAVCCCRLLSIAGCCWLLLAVAGRCVGGLLSRTSFFFAPHPPPTRFFLFFLFFILPTQT